ncbi:hypothetical protein GF323_03250 [Candidatus Woesearchaeota archaeon]|nr:hypothetical protein [Candidatus Woesearchaeota archaeon]
MKKIISVLLIIILIINMLLLAFGLISPLYFWLVIAFIALAAFKAIPKMK